MVALDTSQSHSSGGLLQLNFLDNLVNSLQGVEGGTLYSFCIAQCPATYWAHRCTGEVLCQLAGEKFECADMKHRHLPKCRNWCMGNRRGERRKEEGYARCMACKKDRL